jgi:hypothetical protein
MVSNIPDKNSSIMFILVKQVRFFQDRSADFLVVLFLKLKTFSIDIITVITATTYVRNHQKIQTKLIAFNLKLIFSVYGH